MKFKARGWCCSPIDKPLIEQEPLLRMRDINMHVPVQTPHKVELVVVAHRLTPAELLGLAERAVIEPLDLARLGVVREGVGDPAIVASEDYDLRVGEGERADSVAG